MIIPNECRENASYTPAEPCIPPEGTIQITENGLIDVAQFANANVNVSGGGGGSWELLASTELSITEEPSTTATEIKRLSTNYDDTYRSDKIIVGIARKRSYTPNPSTYIGTDSLFVNPNPKNSSSSSPELTGTTNRALFHYYINSSGEYAVQLSGTNSAGGIYINTIRRQGEWCIASIYTRKLASHGAMVGDYDFYIYALSWADGLEPYK